MRDGALQHVAHNPLKTGFLLTSHKEKSLQRIAKVLDISQIREQIKKTDEFWAVIARKGGYVFWLQVKDESSLQTLVERFRKLSQLPENSTVFPL